MKRRYSGGYLMGLGKPVCLLKEKSMEKLPSDLLGKLYREFDAQDLDASLARVLPPWIKAPPAS